MISRLTEMIHRNESTNNYNCNYLYHPIIVEVTFHSIVQTCCFFPVLYHCKCDVLFTAGETKQDILRLEEILIDKENNHWLQL